jgi:hypothetical protein
MCQVSAHAEGDEPLAINSVRMGPAFQRQLEVAWEEREGGSLYASCAQYRQLVTEVLGRDIRSVQQRLVMPGREKRLSEAGVGVRGRVKGEGRWQLVLEGISLTYDIDDFGNVELRTAAPLQAGT